MFVAAVVFAEEEILERSVPRKRQTEEEIGVGVIKVRRRASAERRGTAGELEAGCGDLVMVHVQPMDVRAELHVVRPFVPSRVHHPLPLRIEVVEHRTGVVVGADAVPVRAPAGYVDARHRIVPLQRRLAGVDNSDFRAPALRRSAWQLERMLAREAEQAVQDEVLRHDLRRRQ